MSGNRCSIVVGLTLVLALASTASTVTARTWLVPDEVPTIGGALDVASAGDIIEIACGTYHEHDLVLRAGVVVRSETGLADCVTIDALQQGRVFIATDLDQAAVLLGLTITGGSVTEDTGRGGGIYCENALLNMAQCDVEANFANYSGGGLHARNSELTIANSRFAANEAPHGGGAGAYASESSGEFLSCLFEANVGIDGAGMIISQSDLSFGFCTFLANEGHFFGGAVFCVIDAGSRFDHCTMVGNTAHLGGGIMVAADSSPTISNTIIAFNGDGAGLECHDAGSEPEIICSDIFGNADGPVSGYIDDPTGVDGNIAFDPWFCDLAEGDLSLATGSPCLPEHNTCLALIGAHTEGCTVTPVSGQPVPATRLAQNHPNPFNPRTTIQFILAEPATVQLRIHDLAGRRVAVLHHGAADAGVHTFEWHGRDDHGRSLPSGTYVYSLKTDDRTETRTMQLVR